LKDTLHLQDADFLKSYNGRMQRIEFKAKLEAQKLPTEIITYVWFYLKFERWRKLFF